MPQVRILSLGPYRVFITDLSYGHSIFLQFRVSSLCMEQVFKPAPLFLCGFSNILDRYTFSGICLVITSAFGYFNIPNKFVMDHNPLTAVFTNAFGFINCYLVYEFPKKRCSQFLHFHKSSDGIDRVLQAVPKTLLLVLVLVFCPCRAAAQTLIEIVHISLPNVPTTLFLLRITARKYERNPCFS